MSSDSKTPPTGDPRWVDLYHKYSAAVLNPSNSQSSTCAGCRSDQGCRCGKK